MDRKFNTLTGESEIKKWWQTDAAFLHRTYDTLYMNYIFFKNWGGSVCFL